MTERFERAKKFAGTKWGKQVEQKTNGGKEVAKKNWQ